MIASHVGALPLGTSPWVQVRDGDDTARAIFDRHYSRIHYADGRAPLLFVGPGEKMVLMTPAADALFIWRRFIDDAQDGSGQPQSGVNCAVFRNEGPARSSDLILAAETWADRRWPGLRRYTYVNPGRIRTKRDPGRCFLRAGWRLCGHTKGGLLILEKLSVEPEQWPGTR